jgi:hypothetical protein
MLPRIWNPQEMQYTEKDVKTKILLQLMFPEQIMDVHIVVQIAEPTITTKKTHKKSTLSRNISPNEDIVTIASNEETSQIQGWELDEQTELETSEDEDITMQDELMSFNYDFNFQLNEKKEIINQAVLLIRTDKGGTGREDAAKLLLTKFGYGIRRFMLTSRHITDADAEELLFDVIHDFITYEHNGKHDLSGSKLLSKIKNSKFINKIRYITANCRKKTTEVRAANLNPVNAGVWNKEAETVPDSKALPHWKKIDIQVAMALFFKEKPRSAQTLELHAQGFSYSEIAAIQGNIKNVTKKQEDAAKSRVLHAQKIARKYFEHCKESDHE